MMTNEERMRKSGYRHTCSYERQKPDAVRRVSCVVPRRGLEPPSLAAYAPQAYAYTNSATWAFGGAAHTRSRPAYYSGPARITQTV